MLAPDEMKIATLALAILFGTGAAAQAGSVDWSEYIDKNPSKPVPVARPANAPAVDGTPAPEAAKPARAGKKVAAKPKAAKPKARAKAKRRH